MPERLQRIKDCQPPVHLTEEDIFRLLRGSVFHQFYALGRLLQLGGQPETAALHFPTLKRDSAEMRWIEETLDQVGPAYAKDPQKGLEALWQKIFAYEETEMEAKQPLFSQPEFLPPLDQILSEGYSLITWLQRIKDTVACPVEEKADHLYFETGIRCFLPELKLIVIARFDELVSTRKRGGKRLARVIDFKSGRKPETFQDPDLAYFLLMTMIAERVTQKYLVKKEGIVPGSGYLPVTIKRFCAEGPIGRALTVFRYLKGDQQFHAPFEVTSPKERERIFELLNGWVNQMFEFKTKYRF